MRFTAALLAIAFPAAAQFTVTLTGQSMIRSDLRSTAPAAVPVIQGLLQGDVIFTNFEAAVAEKGVESAQRLVKARRMYCAKVLR